MLEPLFEHKQTVPNIYSLQRLCAPSSHVHVVSEGEVKNSTLTCECFGESTDKIQLNVKCSN